MWRKVLLLALHFLHSGAFKTQRLSSTSFGIPVNASFDYVVIGGGNAGLAVAARLAEQYSVAVIEAGGFYDQDNGNGTVIAGLAGGQILGLSPQLRSPLLDWDFVTTPQAVMRPYVAFVDDLTFHLGS
jgi:choline dehydrogenase